MSLLLEVLEKASEFLFAGLIIIIIMLIILKEFIVFSVTQSALQLNEKQYSTIQYNTTLLILEKEIQLSAFDK